MYTTKTLNKWRVTPQKSLINQGILYILIRNFRSLKKVSKWRNIRSKILTHLWKECPWLMTTSVMRDLSNDRACLKEN